MEQTVSRKGAKVKKIIRHKEDHQASSSRPSDVVSLRLCAKRLVLMRLPLVTFCAAVIIVLIFTFGASAQSGRAGSQRSDNAPKKKVTRPGAAADVATPEQNQSQSETETANDQQEAEVVKTDTNLVTVPVIASDRHGLYVPDLSKDEFAIFEDGVQQELVFFGTITQPFHVVLMLDTSASTQDKLRQIQRAAIAFVEELQPADRVKVISFDDQIRDLSDFTGDRAVLGSAIKNTRPGRGTKLYDAMERALNALRPIKGRRAIVIFTDGVDWYSDHTTYDDNRRAIEESGVIIYPIRYDTREDVEQLARQQEQSGQTIDLGTIFGGGRPTGATPPIVPGATIPGGGGQDPRGSSFPNIIITRRREDPNDRDRRDERDRLPSRRDNPSLPPNSGGRSDDSIDVMLDQAYGTADAYLNDLANRSGGKLERADTLGSLPIAFANIAAELRTQYSLGYYPSNAARDGKYRKIQVRSNRKNVAIRARPGYRAPQR